MRFFLGFFTLATLVCGYFWLTDAAGSGMGIATCVFGGLGAGVAIYNTVRYGSPLRDSPKS